MSKIIILSNANLINDPYLNYYQDWRLLDQYRKYMIKSKVDVSNLKWIDQRFKDWEVEEDG